MNDPQDLRSAIGGGGPAGLPLPRILHERAVAAAVFERDLIVGAGRRQQAAQNLAAARRLRAELERRESAVRELVASCVTTVDPAPRYAVPDVSAVGEVPNTPAALEAYVARLEQVARAMTLVHTAYGSALAEHAELVGRLDALRAKARSRGVADQPDLARAYDLAAETLARRPCRMAIAGQLVGLYASYEIQARP